MDDERRRILEAGIYLGDIALVLASVVPELPPYVRDLDFAGLTSEGGDSQAVRREVENVLSEQPDLDTIPDSVIRMVLERGIARGKFLSAIHCLEMLDEKDEYIDRYISLARKSIEAGDLPAAAKALIVASNLDLADGDSLFQYSGSGLHEGCTSSPETCVTRLSGDAAVLGGLKYLLASGKAYDAVAELSSEVRRMLLPWVAVERDPNATGFYMDFKKAHSDLEEAQRGEISELEESLKRVAHEVAGFAKSLEHVSPASDEGRDSLEKLKRTASSLEKEFTGIADLLGTWQFKRLKDRLEHLIESKGDLGAMGHSLAEANVAGAAPLDRVLALIGELEEAAILTKVDAVEEKLASTQVTMLGRQVHSQEHWQFLREIAFKYPVSPLMCCLRKIDDRWMVVPVWESEIVGILRDHFETHAQTSPQQG